MASNSLSKESGQSSDNRLFIGIVFAVFIVLESFSVMNHEPWRDEMAVWMVAKYNSLAGIVHEAAVQAQPPLWYFVVKGVQQILPQPLGMSLANLLAIALAVFIILRTAPFSRTEKVLLCFGYFIFYEYGTIARNYGVSVLVLFAACALYSKRKRPYVFLALLLAVGCSIQLMNCVFAVCFLFLLLSEAWVLRNAGQVDGGGRAKVILAMVIITAGVILALREAAPPQGSPWAISSSAPWVYQTQTGALKSVWQSFVPLAVPKMDFWNSNILPDGRLMIVLASGLLGVSCLCLRRRALTAAFYMLGVLALLFFFYRIYHGFTRHHGYIFLMFVSAFWIYCIQDSRREQWTKGYPKRRGEPQFRFFTLVCFINFIGVFVPLYYDWRYPFSASGEVAQYLETRGFDNDILMGDVDYCVAPVAGWLDREIFYPMSGSFSKAVIWENTVVSRRLHPDTARDEAYKSGLWQMALRMAKEKGKDVILILTYPIEQRPLMTFPLSIVPDERYFLYRATPGSAPAM
jgi:hypothetical protein